LFWLASSRVEPWKLALPGAKTSCAVASEIATLPDEVLARNALQAAGNDCFAELFTRHRKRVFYACRGFFSDRQAAEDATQETFLRAYKSISSFQEGDFSWWLLRIAKNVCIDEWRRSRPETGIDGLELADRAAPNSPDSSFEKRQLVERLWREIRSLPTEQRRCLELKVEGFSYEETAIRTGLTVNAVKSHLQNGRRMLWRKMKGALPQFIEG
jgi:RNA polymerase sigma-70 factor (ECF subfamily)